MITLSINVQKLDKLRFVKGEKGIYCDLILIDTPNSDYGDYMVKQGMSKADREAGKETPILGSAKIMRKRVEKPKPEPPPERKDKTVDEDGERIPF